jgi:hypothetical protein
MKYESLYAQAKVDTLDALDILDELKGAEELKSKILFSVVVVNFHFFFCLEKILRRQHFFLAVPPRCNAGAEQEEGGDAETAASARNRHPVRRGGARGGRRARGQRRQLPQGDGRQIRPDPKRRGTIFSENVFCGVYLYLGVFQDVCSQIWMALYDYPCLKTCQGLIAYVRTSVQMAWCLVTQVSQKS